MFSRLPDFYFQNTKENLESLGREEERAPSQEAEGWEWGWGGGVAPLLQQRVLSSAPLGLGSDPRRGGRVEHLPGRSIPGPHAAHKLRGRGRGL